jgi:FKBP-type peptidyl-prolyl cis-trans isomerase FklB
MIVCGGALAQQTPTAKPKTSSTASKTAAKTVAKTPAKATPTSMVLTTDKQKASYALGMNIAASLKGQSVDTETDPSIVAQGLKDALSGGKTLLTEDEARAALMVLQTTMQKKIAEKTQAAGLANKKEGEEFLAANKAKEGVVTLPSGVQYKILTGGIGPKPTASDTVVCNYRGTLINGKEFDSSYKRGQPATFPVGGVIKGWTEVLQLMPVGSKWQVFIPPASAYGERGAGADIGPNETLIFEIELLSIQSAKSEKP